MESVVKKRRTGAATGGIYTAPVYGEVVNQNSGGK